MGIELEGEIGQAEVYQSLIDSKLKQQILNLLNNPITKDAKIKFMPDTHSGRFFPIGLYGEFNINYGIMPSLVGNDIGCGITAVMIDIPKKRFSFDKLDRVIESNIPTGHSNHMCVKDMYDNLLTGLIADVNKTVVWKSFGTLGSGNHFIEIDRDIDDNYWMLVHTGSRYLGNAILEYWLNYCRDNNKSKVYELGVIKDIDSIRNYINDAKVAKKFADYNRDIIIRTICKKSGIDIIEDKMINCCHNIITENNDIAIIRKGVVHANCAVPISINSAEGHLLVKATNGDVNFSLPHGAGRSIPRAEVSNLYKVSEYKKAMKIKGIHCTTITKHNLDECPLSYRNGNYLEKAITDFNLGTIIDRWKPVYSFKPKE